MINRRVNMRVVTQAENCRNHIRSRTGYPSPRYRGVYYWKDTWAARIEVGGKMIDLGTFDRESDAAIWYDCAAKLYFDDPALNFPDDTPTIDEIPENMTYTVI